LTIHTLCSKVIYIAEAWLSSRNNTTVVLMSTNITKAQAALVLVIVVGASLGVYLYFTTSGSGADTIKIGITYPQTGSGAENGMWMYQAAVLAVEEINAAGGVLGKNLSLYFADDESKIETGVSAAERLITQDGVHVLAGGYSSSISLAIMDLVAEYKVPWLIACSVATDIPTKIASDPAKYKYIWKFVANGSAYGVIKAEWIKYIVENGTYTPDTETYALITEDTDYGRDLADAFDTSMAPLGWTKVADHTVASDESDYYSVLTDIKSLDPDFVISVQTSVPAGVALVKQFRELNVTSILVPDLLPSRPDYIPLAGNATVEGLPWIYFPVLNPSVPEAATFFNAFNERWGRYPVTAAADQYSAIYIMADAIARAGSLNPDAIAAALADTDMRGPLGRYVFGSTHECLAGADYMMGGVSQIWDGVSYFIFPEEIAERAFVVPPWSIG
jgi:branched-chain amino acid transport system substrate-binding protein